MVVDTVRDVPAPGEGRDQERSAPGSRAGRVRGSDVGCDRRGNVIEEAAPLVEGDHEQGLGQAGLVVTAW